MAVIKVSMALVHKEVVYETFVSLLDVRLELRKETEQVDNEQVNKLAESS